MTAKMDYLKKLHRYSVGEVAAFSDAKATSYLENGTGMYFYSASHIETLVMQQESKVLELESKLKRIIAAHDKLFMQLRKLQKATDRAIE